MAVAAQLDSQAEQGTAATLVDLPLDKPVVVQLNSGLQAEGPLNMHSQSEGRGQEQTEAGLDKQCQDKEEER